MLKSSRVCVRAWSSSRTLLLTSMATLTPIPWVWLLLLAKAGLETECPLAWRYYYFSISYHHRHPCMNHRLFQSIWACGRGQMTGPCEGFSVICQCSLLYHQKRQVVPKGGWVMGLVKVSGLARSIGLKKGRARVHGNSLRSQHSLISLHSSSCPSTHLSIHSLIPHTATEYFPVDARPGAKCWGHKWEAPPDHHSCVGKVDKTVSTNSLVRPMDTASKGLEPQIHIIPKG